MKTILIIQAICLAVVASSCRTSIPLDPNTMKPSCRCMPHKYQATPPEGCGHCGGVRYSK
jgi:hypothetical protein